jgi:two-component system, CitB family, sensor kinase
MSWLYNAYLSYLYPRKLKSKLVVLILAIIVFQMGVIGTYTGRMISELLEEQIGSRALKVSQTVSEIPTIQKALEKGHIAGSPIQEIAETIRKKTGAQFIVVGDKDGRRYSHPIKERLGKYMVGGDNDGALKHGKSYISKAVGTLGPSIRGKVPIFNQEEKIIGLVSVGYLMENVNTIIWEYQIKIFIFILVVVIIGIVAAIKIADGFKKAIFGLEPNEIAGLLQERTATLETIREGVVAVNGEGLITTINQAAIDTLGIKSDSDLIGKPIIEVFPQTKILDVLKTGESQFDQEMIRWGTEIIANRIPIFNKNKINGVVSSFRKKNELDILAKELSQVQQYSDSLRAQTHEYSNKLYTISGLIQIGDYQKAIDLISSESSGYQEIINSLMRIVPNSILAGAILGKYTRARELKIELEIDPDSSMSDIPKEIKLEKLVTIIGNLLENAFEAVLNNNNSNQRVNLSMTDLGNDLIFEIDDSGPGIDQENTERIFEKGFTTKIGHGFGMGLHLVERALNYLKGTIVTGKSDLGGVAFTVIIPKQQSEKS